MKIQKDILYAFNVDGEINSLNGGQNTSIRVRDGNVKQKLEVSRIFHSDLAAIGFTNIPKADDPWSIAQRIAWQGSPVSELGIVCHSKFNIEMILRAVIFRLSVAAIFAGNNYEEFIEEYKNFKLILDYINCETGNTCT